MSPQAFRATLLRLLGYAGQAALHVRAVSQAMRGVAEDSAQRGRVMTGAELTVSDEN